jgi:UPF0271 protein
MTFTPAEIERLVAYQIGAAMALAAYAGHRLTYVKIHGALSNLAMEDAAIAEAAARAVKGVDPGLCFLAVAGTRLVTAGHGQGLKVASEIYADRGYTEDGLLMDRTCPGAVLCNVSEIADRALAMVAERAIVTASGKRLPVEIDSICIHGDSPNAVAMAKAVRSHLEGAGVRLAPFAPR